MTGLLPNHIYFNYNSHVHQSTFKAVNGGLSNGGKAPFGLLWRHLKGVADLIVYVQAVAHSNGNWGPFKEIHAGTKHQISNTAKGVCIERLKYPQLDFTQRSLQHYTPLYTHTYRHIVLQHHHGRFT